MARKRKPLSLETKKKISESEKGKFVSQETRDKISKAVKGRIWSVESRKKASESHKGEKAYQWKGGSSRKYKEDYYSLKYKLWRESVFQRDNYTCRGCGFKGNQGYLTAHHIKSWAKFPELRFDINNGKTLCEDCHKLTDNYKGRERRK